MFQSYTMLHIKSQSDLHEDLLLVSKIPILFLNFLPSKGHCFQNFQYSQLINFVLFGICSPSLNTVLIWYSPIFFFSFRYQSLSLPPYPHHTHATFCHPTLPILIFILSWLGNTVYSWVNWDTLITSHFLDSSSFPLHLVSVFWKSICLHFYIHITKEHLTLFCLFTLFP